MIASSVFEVEEAPQGWVRLVVVGELDISTAVSFRRRLGALRATNTDVWVDLSQLEFIDGAGVHALRDAIAQSQEGDWRLEVAPNIPVQARRVLDLISAAGLPAGI